MGESNTFLGRKKSFTGKNIYKKMNKYYSKHFTNKEGKIEATFEIITITCWKTDSNQPKPLKPNAAIKSMKDFF